MVDKSRVPDYRVFDVVLNSQPQYDRVRSSYSNGKEIWVLKKGRDHTFTFRCDRSVREALNREWVAREENGALRPTKLGLEELAAWTAKRKGS